MTLTSNRLVDDYIGMVARPRLGLNIDSVKETCPTITIFNSVIILTINNNINASITSMFLFLR